MREEILQYQHDFYKNARQEAATKKQGAIVFGNTKDAARTYHLAEILKRHQITFHHLKSDVTIKGTDYKKGYSYVVPKNQKNTRLINAMFEKRTKFQDSLFYDVSAWTFPLAFNLDYDDTVTTAIAGDEVEQLTTKIGKVTDKSSYAYLMEWHEYYSPKALNAILSKGLRAKVGMKPFSVGGKNYDYGTILIPVQNQKLNSEELYAFLQQTAKNSFVEIHGVTTGLTQGIDLGSNQFRALSVPRVGLLVGNGVRSYDAGEMWHLFDTRYDMRISKLDVSRVSRMDLSRYNVIIVPSSGGLSERVTKALRTWTEQGGTLIGYRSTINWLKAKEFINLEVKKKDRVAKNITFEQRGNYSGAQVIGGAIFEVEQDRSHPINFGYTNNKIPMFRNNTIFMEADKQSYNNPLRYSKNPLLSGYISKPNLDSLASTVPYKSKRLKSGKVVVFTDNTNFRAFWYGTNKLLMNAIFFREEL